MPRPAFATVDDYIASHPDDGQVPLRWIRALVHALLPDAVERISYQIPCYRVHGRDAIYFAGYPRHWSIYPISAAARAELGPELLPWLSGKATLRVPLGETPPEELIRRVVLHRAAEISRLPAKR